MRGERTIKEKHVNSNRNVRGALVQTGIHPESLPAGEDVKKIEARHRKELKHLQSKQRAELEEVKKRAGKEV